eukprot:2332931-Rhodomonas_salina.3
MDMRSHCNKLLDQSEVVECRGLVQHRVAEVVSMVHARAIVNQQLDDVKILVWNRVEHRCRSILVLGRCRGSCLE